MKLANANKKTFQLTKSAFDQMAKALESLYCKQVRIYEISSSPARLCPPRQKHCGWTNRPTDGPTDGHTLTTKN